MIIVFNHVPKTAGTSFFEQLIKPNFKNDEIKASNHSRKPNIILNNKIKLLHGHIPFSVPVMGINHIEHITLLRDPIERAISEYYFIRQCKYPTYEHPFWKYCIENPIDEVYKPKKNILFKEFPQSNL